MIDKTTLADKEVNSIDELKNILQEKYFIVNFDDKALDNLFSELKGGIEMMKFNNVVQVFGKDFEDFTRQVRELPKINENGVEIFYEFISFDMADKFKKEIEILDKDILKVKEQLNSLENISEQDRIFLNTDIEGMILDLREHLNDLTEKKNNLENTLSKLEQKMQERELEQDKGKQEKSIVKKEISFER